MWRSAKFFVLSHCIVLDISGLPVRVAINGFSIYTHINRVCYYLLKPVTCQSTVTMTSQYHMASNDSQEKGHLSSLSLNAHTQVASVTCNISKSQVTTTLKNQFTANLYLSVFSHNILKNWVPGKKQGICFFHPGLLLF